jgi:hypothetical protein
LKFVELGNLPFRLAPGGRAREGFGNGPALNLVCEAEVGAMARMVGLMTMTAGLAAEASDAGDRTTAEVTEPGDLANQLGALVFQSVKRLGRARTC